MKIGQRAWNKDIREIGAYSRPIRWNPHQDTATVEEIGMAVITLMASAIVIYTTHN